MLHLDGFDGPLDLLADLAERQRIDLGRLSVPALVAQFVAGLEQLADTVLIERRASWLVVVARLLHLRSRLLFPASPEEAADAERDAAAELQRIEVLAQMRLAAAWLDARPVLGRDVFTRPALRTPRQSGYVALLEACLAVIRGRDGHVADAPLYRVGVANVWRVADALNRIREVLQARSEGAAFAACLPRLAGEPLRVAVASTLVAALELARGGEIMLEQAAQFGRIHIKGK